MAISILDILKNVNSNNFFNTVKDYLASINKSEYELLLYSYIKLDIAYFDSNYSNTRNLVKQLESDNFEIDTYDICLKYYDALKQDRVDIAEICLNIINKYFESDLEFPLLTTMNEYYTNRGPGFTNKFEVFKKEFEHKISELRATKSVNSFSNISNEKKYILSNICKGTNDIFYGEIYNFAYICYCPEKDSNEDMEPINKEATDELSSFERFLNTKKGRNTSRREQKAKAIKIINKYMKVMHKGKATIDTFIGIGKCYYYTGNYDKALYYTKIATKLNPELLEDKIVRILIGKKEERTKACYVDILNNNFGIDNINEIIEEINNGSSIPDACMKYELNEEEIQLVFIIVAKEYYKNGDAKVAQAVLLALKSMPNKTENVTKYIEILDKTGKLYKNRTDAEHLSIRTLRISGILCKK